MNKLRIIFTMLAAAVCSIVIAAPPEKPPPGPQDVNVVNTPDVNVVNIPNVTVTNPQTSLTIDNTTSNPVPVSVQGDISVASEPRFIGLSDAAVQGGNGLADMHGACRDTFGSGARMCLTIEVFKTPDLQPIDNPLYNLGWIAPQVLDIGDTYHCDWWTSSTGYGMTLDVNSMGIRTASCAATHAVACCR